MNSTKLSGLIVFPKKISRQRSRDFSLIQIQDSKIQSFNEIPSSSSTDAHILNHCLSLFCQAQNYSYLASLRNTPNLFRRKQGGGLTILVDDDEAFITDELFPKYRI